MLHLFRGPTAHNLSQFQTHSFDRYIASLCIQLAPDPDAVLREAVRVLKPSSGIAGFTIWGRPEYSGLFTIPTQVLHQLGLPGGHEHHNFVMGKNLPALKKRFHAAGFSHVRMWPFTCVSELWSGQSFADFFDQLAPTPEDDREYQEHYDLMTRKADEWLEKGLPIGLDVILIIAKV